jgi:hypothetical protein
MEAVASFIARARRVKFVTKLQRQFDACHDGKDRGDTARARAHPHPAREREFLI